MNDTARTNARPRAPPVGTVRSVSGPVPFHDVTVTPVMSIVPYWAISAETSLVRPLGRLCSRSSFTSPDRFSRAPPCTTRSEFSSHIPGLGCTRGAPGQAALISVSVSTELGAVR